MEIYVRASVRNLYADDYEVRKTTAETTSRPDVLRAMVFDVDYGVRMAVARNLATPVDALAILADDPNYYVRAEVADNPNAVTPEIMATLLKRSQDNYYIRDMIANCPASGPDTLWFFVEHGEFDEKSSVINNPSTPYDFLVALTEDDDAQIQWEAEQKLREIGGQT